MVNIFREKMEYSKKEANAGFSVGSLLAFAAILLIGITALGFCGADLLCAQENGQVLRVGVTPNSPPIIYKENGEIVGLEADFAKALASELKMGLELVELKWMDQIPSLQQGKIDIIMSGMTITQMRRMRINFADPYLRIGQMALIRMKDARKYILPYSVVKAKARIGVEKGTTGDFLVQRSLQNAKRREFSSVKKAVNALIRGKIDVVIHDAPVIMLQAANNEGNGLMLIRGYFTKEYLGWGINRDDKYLLNAVNNILERWVKWGKLKDMISQWLPDVE